MITVVLYVLCLFPFFAGEILYYFDFIEDKLAFILLSLFVRAFAYSWLNPYIYLTFIQKFRSGFQTLFGNCLRNIKFYNSIPFRFQSVELQQA